MFDSPQSDPGHPLRAGTQVLIPTTPGALKIFLSGILTSPFTRSRGTLPGALNSGNQAISSKKRIGSNRKHQKGVSPRGFHITKASASLPLS